jgi:hypothetical protein
MLENMLGRPRETDLFGLVYDFISKLRSGSITATEVKRFLRKEDPLQKSETPAQKAEKLTLNAGEVSEFMALIDTLERRSELSHRDMYGLVGDYMLARGLTLQAMLVRYEQVCPDYRKKDSIAHGLTLVGEFIEEWRMSLYIEIYNQMKKGEKTDPVELIRQRAHKSFGAII